MSIFTTEEYPAVVILFRDTAYNDTRQLLYCIEKDNQIGGQIGGQISGQISGQFLDTSTQNRDIE